MKIIDNIDEAITRREKGKTLAQDEMITGNFLMELPFTEGGIEKVTYQFIDNKMMIYIYMNNELLEFKPEDVRFHQLDNKAAALRRLIKK